MKIKFSADLARLVGEQILQLLAPHVETVIIAGSLRRKRAEVGDIEILYIPKITTRRTPGELFETKPEEIDETDAFLKSLLESGLIAKRLNKFGRSTWGELNKLAIHAESGIPIDFFKTIPRNWFVSLAIRTGGKDTNLELTAGANKRNLTLNAYGSGVTHLQTGKVTDAISEEHVFELCGVSYKEPHLRK